MRNLIENYLDRLNDSVYEVFQAEIASKKNNSKDEIRCLRSASESVSQSLENALKSYLNKNLSSLEARFLKDKPSIQDLIKYFINEHGEPGDYYHDTQNELNPSVDFFYLKSNKSVLTNWCKHNGDIPSINVIERYIRETRNFILEYLNPQARIKDKEDFYKSNTANWDLLYSTCDRFNPNERTLILVIGQNQNVNDHHLRSLGLPRWNLVIDFDYYSESNGFFKSAFGYESPSPHKLKIEDTFDNSSFSRYSQTHYHLFADNFLGSGFKQTTNFNDWNRKYAKKADFFLRSFAEVYSNQKTIVLILFNSKRHVDAICSLIDRHFGGTASFVFGNDLKDELTEVTENWNGIKVNIPISEIAEGLNNYSTNFGTSRLHSDKYIVPHMEESESITSGELTLTEFTQYEEYFEVLHKNLPNSDEGELDRMNFLTGSQKIGWYGIARNFDVQKRSFAKSFIKPLERIFENARGKINLIHDAGFGGTTVARRIAWHFHEEYPTLILKKYKDNKVRELLIKLHQKTRKAIFLILEVPQSITLDDAESLYNSIDKTRPIVFLIVRRGKPKTENDLVVNDWGNDVNELIDAYKPFLEFDESINNRKLNELEEIINSNDPTKKTPFYIGLLTFEEKFYAIKDFIYKFCIEVNDKDLQKKALLYLSICQYYIGQGLPAMFFRKLFKLEHADILQLEHYFSTESGVIDALLSSDVEGIHKVWKIKHTFFAKELLQQLLSGMSENPEIWKQGLPDICYNLVWDSSFEGNISEYTEEILQKLFIGNRRDRAGTNYTQIINDIETLDGKERVFKALKDAYPDNPHYCSHLARFYAYDHKNKDLALQYANEAISLSLAEGFEDPLLYHIKGMCLRSNVYDIMQKHTQNKLNGYPPTDDEYYHVIETLIPQCESQFELSRKINKNNYKTDEYGFIANIQLLIRAIDYGITISGKSRVQFFQNNPEPFSDWLDNAESLLEEVKRINLDDDENGYIQECSNHILEFYENYEQILQNLRSLLEKGKNPTRIRRQMVRTYFRKKENYQVDSRTISNILSLMESNINNEPDNEKNFYLWFQAARHSRISIEEAITKLSKWKANSSAIDAVYYFYILKVIRALQGYSEAAQDAYNLIRECKQKGRSNIVVYEWLGKGNSLDKLVSRNIVNAENKEDKLTLVEGYFTDYLHDGSGKITIADRLEVFFSPTQAKLSSSDINQQVEFYLGFSFDGLRADSYSVRIKGSQPRNKELLFENTPGKSKPVIPELYDNRILKDRLSRKIPSGTVEQNENMPHEPSKHQTGIVVDLQKPPYYAYGFIENEFGERYFFHKNTEKNEVFNKLGIKTHVKFESKITAKGKIAFNIRISDSL